MLIALWAASLAGLLLEKTLGDGYPGTWGTADAMAMGLLVIPTIAAAYSTFYLTGSIRRLETQLGSYADKDEQIKVRKAIALRHAQGKLLTWLKAAMVAVLIVVAVMAMQ